MGSVRFFLQIWALPKYAEEFLPFLNAGSANNTYLPPRINLLRGKL
jgi:hypothetical protein